MAQNVDNFSTKKIADEFVSPCNDNTRKKVFGKFEQQNRITHVLLLMDIKVQFF